MTPAHFFSQNLLNEIEIPQKGILSHTIYNDDQVKVVIFGFSVGQELSAHTAPMPATLYFLSGKASLRLGHDEFHVQAGSFAQMQPDLPHSIAAEEPTVMLLVMIKGLRSSQ